MSSLQDVPLMAPPPGQVTNFNQNSNLWPVLISVSTITLAIMAFAVLARLGIKVIKSRPLLWEDYLSAFATLLIIVWTTLYDVACGLGISRHGWNFRVSLVHRAFNLLNICDILYGPMLCAAKLSLLVQLRRYSLAAGTPKNRMKWLIYPTCIITFGYYFSCIFQFAFQCIPRKGLWDPTVKHHCSDAPALTMAAATFALLTDLMLYALLLWLIVIATPQKLGGWLGLGAINVVALFGITTASASFYYRVPFMNPGVDITYDVAIVGIWAMAEYAAIILAGCIPAFGLFRHQEKTTDEEKSGSSL